MKPALPMNRSKPQLHTDFTAHATEPTTSKNYKWTSKTFPDVSVRMMTDSQSEYEQYVGEQDEQTDYDYEYVTSSSLEDLRHMKIYPAKPMNTQSVYADKRSLLTIPPPRLRPQTALRQQSMMNIQPSTQYKSSNMQREKKSSDSHAAQGPAVDRTVKPCTTVKDPFQSSGPILDYKQPARPPPRPPKSIPKEFQQLHLEPSHTHIFSGPDNLPHFLNKPSITQPENNIGLCKNKQNETLIPRNGTDFRSPPDVIPPMRQQRSLPFKTISKSVLPPSSLHQTTQMPDPSRRQNLQSSPDLQKPKHVPRVPAKDLEGNIWYVGACDRYKAEEALKIKNMNGAFLVRDSSKGIPDKPYVLLVYYRFKVYSIQIRYLEDTKQYALGSGLRGHDIFDSVPDIIEIHRNIPLRLIDRRDQSGSQMEQCTLTIPLTLH
ncbi:cytokine-dependent hematopoietic cell linker [Carcharodon carcharias]|uniref:cytokine-dependent hematopoietic cell linker n=1 Tax=Carcharodon carcharias TaxID=13397 RepID=UPI001B7DA0AC|nr:cytokine-dependent hematopoietic cell linker [Carcharodon carcharias]XP_041052347.1 cytokine-dependent hematopoietic cell linker [Carcharodon carcharias]